MAFLSRTDKSFIAQWWWTIDFKLFLIFLGLIATGIMLVATASPSVALRIGLDQYHFFIRHLIILIPALVLMLGISFLSVRQIHRLAMVTLFVSFFMLIYVLLFGVEIKGAQRWIHLPFISLQPSEIVKPAIIVVVSWFLSKKKENDNFPGLRIIAGLYAVFAMLLLSQPDFGMTFVVTCTLMAVVFIGGLPLRIVAVLMATGIVCVVIVYFSFSHVQSRVDRFINPDSGDNYQIDKSLDAFREGGLLGTGPGQGTIKLSIPDAHADFIFSVAGEELGLITLVIVLLFGALLYRGFSRLYASDNLFVILSTGGLLSLIGLQAIIHMGSALQLLPAKGMTLPFISYGGSSLLSMGITAGMILALTRRQVQRQGQSSLLKNKYLG